MSPLQRSIALMKSRGYIVAIVEHWNQWAKIRQDLFGFIDLLCIKGYTAARYSENQEDAGIVGVQVTGLGGWHPHLKKIKDSPIYPIFKDAGGRVLLHGWRKLKRDQNHCGKNTEKGLLRPLKASSSDRVSPDNKVVKKGLKQAKTSHWVAKEEWL